MTASEGDLVRRQLRKRVACAARASGAGAGQERTGVARHRAALLGAHQASPATRAAGAEARTGEVTAQEAGASL